MKTDVEKFLRKAKKRNGGVLAARTKELYLTHLERFIEWLHERGIDRWDQVTVDLVEAYLDYPDWSVSTRWNALCSIRRLFRWMFGETSEIVQITMHRNDCEPQRTLTRAQVDQLFCLFDTTTPKGTRDLAICALLLDTGLRAEELVSAKMEHLSLDEGVLMAHLKGDAWGPAVFFEYTRSCVARWLAVRETIARPGVATVFVSIGGLRPGTPITRDGLRAIFRRFSLQTDLGLVSPHDMRRTFATLAIEAGAPTRTVQVAVRWSTIKMVERYSRALQAKAIHPYSPVNVVMGIKPATRREN